MTLSPTWSLLSEIPLKSPIASMTPVASAPRIQGGMMFTPGMPATTNRSRWLSAAALTRMRISPRLGSGFGRSVRYSSWSSPPCAEIVSPRTRLSERYIQSKATPAINVCAHHIRRARMNEDTDFDFHPLRISLNALHKGPPARRIDRRSHRIAVAEEGRRFRCRRRYGGRAGYGQDHRRSPALKPGVLARRAKNEGDVVH